MLIFWEGATTIHSLTLNLIQNATEFFSLKMQKHVETVNINKAKIALKQKNNGEKKQMKNIGLNHKI